MKDKNSTNIPGSNYRIRTIIATSKSKELHYNMHIERAKQNNLSSVRHITSQPGKKKEMFQTPLNAKHYIRFTSIFVANRY